MTPSLKFAQQQPKDAEALGRLRTIRRVGNARLSGSAIVETVNAALAIPKAEWPQIQRQAHVPEGTPRGGASQGAAAAHLRKAWRGRQMIGNTDDLEKIALDGEKAEVPAMSGWRRELFGDYALKLINGGVALRFVGKKIEAVELA